MPPEMQFIFVCINSCTKSLTNGRKGSLIYAVLSQNFFCRDLHTFRVEKNAAKILVHGEKKSDKYKARWC